MANTAVVTDSACDLPRELAEERGVRVVPLKVRFGDEEFIDRTQLEPSAFWARLAASTALPQTAAPSPGDFEAAYLAARDAGCDGVVCVTLSGALSATYQAAEAAAQAVRDQLVVRVVDSRTVTIAEGFVVLAALEAAEQGASLDEVERAARAAAQRTTMYGLVDTLEYLHRGGRIGGAAALLGSLLSIKPVVEVRDGVVEVESRQRTRARGVAHLVERATQLAPLRRIGVAHGLAADVDDVVQQLAAVGCSEPPIVVELGPVVGTHTGPGSLGIGLERLSER
jgi:DegV family protein with EDD domain